MKDINVLINNNVDLNKGIEILRDLEMYNETLEYFLSEINNRISKLKRALESSDIENYSIEVSILKKEADSLGFNYLAELAYKHEINAKTKDDIYVKENFELLMNELNKMIKVSKIYLGIEKEDSSNNETGSLTKKILVVDDSNLVRNLLKKMISNEYEIVTASDGKEAIDTLSFDRKALVGILLDLNMPNVNGFQVLEYLKQNNLFEKIKVAIITGDDSRETVLKAFDYPIVDVLAKPFNESDVQRVVTAMLTHN